MLVRFFSLFLLLLTSGVSFAQPLPDRLPVTGLAVDKVGKPLAGAIVSIRRQDDNGPYAFWSDTAVANEKGQFRFGAAETGRYYLNIELPGFAPIYNQAVDWKSGATPLRIKMDRLVGLEIKLKSADGKPVANTFVWIRLWGDGSAGQNTQGITTDANGLMRVDGLTPANYSLFLGTPDGYSTSTDIPLQDNASRSLILQQGGTLHIDVKSDGATPRGLGGFLLLLTPENIHETVRLMGQVADPNEDFAFLAARGDRLFLVSREGDGQIEIPNLPPGNYSAKVTPTGYGPVAVRAVKIEAGQTSELEMDFAPKDTPKTNLTVQLNEVDGKAAHGEMSMRLLPITESGMLATEEYSEDNPLGSLVGRRAKADENGRVTLFPVKPGRYRVFANHFIPGKEGTTESASVDVMVPAQGATASLVLKASS